MKLQDFLKVKKARCFIGGATVTTGRVYDVVGLDKAFIHVIDDNGEVAYYWYSRFEPVLDMSKSAPEIDTSANSVDNCQAPHVSSPSNNDAPHAKFKIGDPVYWANDVEGKIHKLGQYLDGAGWRLNNSSLFVPECLLCLATPENHALLCKLYPHINFEAPSLIGGDLVEAMLKKGIKNVLCLDKHGNKHVITNKAGIMFVDMDGFNSCGDLTPIDWVTDEPLTEAVLDE